MTDRRGETTVQSAPFGEVAGRSPEDSGIHVSPFRPGLDALRAVVIIHNTGDPDRPENAAEEGVLETVEAVERVLNAAGRPVVRLPLRPPFSEAAQIIEGIPQSCVVFNLFEGFPGDPSSEVQVGLLLQSLGLRATGCPPLSMHLGLHKDLCKQLLSATGLPAVPGLVCTDADELAGDLPFPFPVFLKPAASDSSHGIGPANVVGDAASLQARSAELLEVYPEGILVEPFLTGREFNCGVAETCAAPLAFPPSIVDYAALPAGHPPVLTFAAKWEPGSPVYEQTPTVCPAPVESETLEAVRDLSLKAFRALRCRGYARVDFREDAEGKLHILEINPNPDLAPSAGLAKQARALGWEYDRLVMTILAAAEKGAPWTSR
jgi:D-alanine-D-alanine ligase